MRLRETGAALMAGVVIGALALLSSGCSRCSRDLQERALRDQSLEMCKTTTHRSGKACSSEVERKLPVCIPPFLAKRTTPEEFATCLGFVLP